ncbi:MAG: alpha/beta fold hydrolase, partial [Chloroflexota bacterium]
VSVDQTEPETPDEPVAEPTSAPTELAAEPTTTQAPTEAPTETPVPPTATPVEEVEAAIAEELPSLEIVNSSGSDICDIAIASSDAEEWGNNVLDEALLTDESLFFEDIDPGLYDFLALDCEENVVTEEFEIALGQEPILWFIGEGFEVTESASTETAVAETDAPATEETTETAAETTQAVNNAVGAAQFEAGTCPFDTPGAVVECGFLLVPENRTRADSPTIELAVAIVRAAGQAKPDPIIFLDGGPGSSALVSFSGDIEGWLDYPFHQDHDLIFLDQRGTGYSFPSLNCPEVEDGLENAEALCRDRLVAEGVDLTAYNTAENASDVAALWQTLGYQSVNLYGVSYGTRLGFAVMRDHPQGIRSVVLDSPFPPSIDLPTEEGITNWTAIQHLFRSCSADPLCNESYPNLEATFLDTVARLNNNPGEVAGQEVYGDDIVSTVVQALYVPDLIALLPRAIYDASQGNLDTYDLVAIEAGGGASRFGRFQDGEDLSDSEGMYNSVTCRDEYSFGDYGRAEGRALSALPPALQDSLFYGNSGNLFDVCDMWGAGAAAPKENEAVISDIPTLILAGEFDPVTPPSWGRIAAETLSNSYFYELPGFGHSLSSDPGCPTTLLTQFFTNPNVAPDSSCINELLPPQYYLPDEPLGF